MILLHCFSPGLAFTKDLQRGLPAIYVRLMGFFVLVCHAQLVVVNLSQLGNVLSLVHCCGQ